MGYVRKSIRRLERAIFSQIVVAIIFIDLIILVLCKYELFWTEPLLEFERKTAIVAFATVPAVLVTVLAFRNTIDLQEATFVKDYVTKFYTDKDLSQAFYYLVYTYKDNIYDEFMRASESRRQELQGSRVEGIRFYDPFTFQGSEEERRLDNLLGYFDIIAYNYFKGIVGMKEIASLLGYQLTFLLKKKVMIAYLDKEDLSAYWRKIDDSKGAKAPFNYLSRLLDEFDKYNGESSKKYDLGVQTEN